MAPEPAPCLLADLPAPTKLGAQAQGDGTFVIQRDRMEALGGYLAEIQVWISAATYCLQAGQRLPIAPEPSSDASGTP